ncbi:MAG: CBS domain-containing protein [Candidatus Rokubacteria bacterium]|nr:CBS domain-containing protein [Candidatus Rokubacteria bacterium]
MSEFQDEYSESLEAEFRQLDEALLSDTVSRLAPSEPIALAPEATVKDAIDQMVARRRAGVVIVDEGGRLFGIFTERDVLTRVLGKHLDIATTRLRDVMTPEPEALRPDDRICFAINRMNNAGYRTIPLVDEARRPIGIVTVNDVVQWLATLFPEAILNLRPGDKLKRPCDLHGG